MFSSIVAGIAGATGAVELVGTSGAKGAVELVGATESPSIPRIGSPMAPAGSPMAEGSQKVSIIP